MGIPAKCPKHRERLAFGCRACKTAVDIAEVRERLRRLREPDEELGVRRPKDDPEIVAVREAVEVAEGNHARESERVALIEGRR